MLSFHRKSLEAIIDPLTNLPNVRATKDRFEEVVKLIKRSRETDHPQKGFFCFIDADSFKEINDTYGHQSGDEILQKIADLIKSNIKATTDFVSRIGGDEFTMIFTFSPENEDEIKKRIREIHQIIDDQLFVEVNGKKVFLKVSIGVEEINQDSNYEGTKEKADQKLYTAKGKGENTVVF